MDVGTKPVEKGHRKYRIASRSLWMTFALTLAMLGVAWASDDEQGQNVRSAIEAVTEMWPWALGAIGVWFGFSNAAVHAAQRDGDG